MKKIIQILFISLAAFFISFLVIPEAMFYIQAKNIINSGITSREISKKSLNNETKKFFKENPQATITDVTDFQGSNIDTGYLVATLKKHGALGVLLKYRSAGPYLYDFQVVWVGLYHSELT